jgi:hypothetical protein
MICETPLRYSHFHRETGSITTPVDPAAHPGSPKIARVPCHFRFGLGVSQRKLHVHFASREREEFMTRKGEPSESGLIGIDEPVGLRVDHENGLISLIDESPEPGLRRHSSF